VTVTISPAEAMELGRALQALTTEQRAAYIAGLNPDEARVVATAITALEYEGADWRATPTTMAHHLTNGRVKLWRYSRLLGEKFVDAVEGRSTRQIWNLPRRYGKSFFASQWGPAWALDHYPHLKLLLVSYGDELALENAVAVRDILRQHGDQLRAQLRPDRQQAGRFVTTEGGSVLARGIHSGIVGFGADGAIFDDPHKGWPEAHSAAQRDAIDNQFRSVVAGTLETETSWMIVPMTRWHEEDLSGRLLARMEQESGVEWELVRIPELAEPPQMDSAHPWLRLPDPLGRAPGQPIEPERFRIESIRLKHRIAGSYLTASMYQQRPSPEEGGDIKRAWFRIEDALPPRFDTAISSWDMKLKDKETGDYVVGQYWGRTGKDFWLGDQLRGQWNQATTEAAIALMAVRHPDIRAHHIENTGNGPEVMEALRSSHPGYTVSDDVAGQLGMGPGEADAVNNLRRRGMGALLPVIVKGSKGVRLRAVSGYMEAGDVHLLKRDYIGAYLEEMASFPQGAHDDQCDATSQALSKLARGSATVTRAAGSIPKAPINTRQGTTAARTGRVVTPRTGGY